MSIDEVAGGAVAGMTARGRSRHLPGSLLAQPGLAQAPLDLLPAHEFRSSMVGTPGGQ